jgi:hypothetical protein
MSLSILKFKIESRINSIDSNKHFLKERKERAKNDLTKGFIAGKADGLEDEQHTLKILLKQVDNLIEQSQNLDVEPQNSPLEQPSFLLCAKVSNEQINHTRL